MKVGEEEGGERCREDDDEAAHDALEHEHRRAGTVHGVTGVVCMQSNVPPHRDLMAISREWDERVSIRQW